MNPFNRFRKWLYITLALCSFGINACSDVPAPDQPGLYIPPTLAATSAPIPTETPTLEPPTPVPGCISSLVYLEDLTIQDGTLVSSGQILDKRWRVSNAGTCNWTSDYTIKLIAGSNLGAQSPLALYPAVSGSEAVIMIQYTAPESPGIYRSAWQAFDPQDVSFGDPIYIEIVVE